MELIIRNKWVSIGGSSYIKDINDKELFNVKGKIFSFTRKKFLYDMDGNLKYIIRNKFFRLFQRKAFILNEKGEEICLIRRKIFSLHDHYFITSSLGDLEIKGNILQYNYSITLDGKEIGHIARRVSLRDSFVLTLDDNYDAATFIAFVIAIDNITDRKDAQYSN